MMQNDVFEVRYLENDYGDPPPPPFIYYIFWLKALKSTI